MKLPEQKNHTKKRSVIILIIISILLLLFGIFGYLIYKAEYEKHEILVSQNDPYKLIIYQSGTPDFPFGQSDCTLQLIKDNKTIDETDIILHNDGKWPDAQNFTVSWLIDSVTITVHGEEQEDMTYVLYFDD